MGLIFGGAAAVVVVAVLLVVTVSGLFASPQKRVEKAVSKTLSAYSDAGDKMDLPSLEQLLQGRSYSQRISVELNSISPQLTWYDLTPLAGLGVRMNTDYDQKSRKLGCELAAFWDGEDFASLQLLADGGNLCFASPEFTEGRAYGLNTETLGADLDRLGADGGIVDLKKIGFNLFDLVESSTPSDQQIKEIKNAIAKANKQLFSALEVEKTGKETIQVNGASVNATAYRVVIPKDAMKDYINALEDAMKIVDAQDLFKQTLESIGLDKSLINEIMSEMNGTDPYGELADGLKQLVKIVGDLELDVYVSGGRVCAVEYSDRIEGSKLEIGLYLGGSGNYVDDLSLEVSVDGNELLVESTGSHRGANGVFTDETVIRLRYGGSDVARVTSEFRYEPAAKTNNFQWEINVNNAGSLEMEGQLTAKKNSINLQLDDVTLRAAGTKLISLAVDYYLGPYDGTTVSLSSPKMLADLDEDDLMDLYFDLMYNIDDWTYDVGNRIPIELLRYIF